jgi:hypothetical protein
MTELQLSFYNEGVLHGTWTAERVRKSGSTAEECLAVAEQDYQNEVDNLPDLRERNPEYATQHEVYLNGSITAARETLGALIQEGL